MSSQSTIIIIPGLGDRVAPMIWATKHWKQVGLTPIVHSMEWKKEDESFTTKFKKLLKRIDSEYALGNKVSLVGSSAGGSAVINAFTARKNKIHRVVNVCGRMRVGENTGFRAFSRVTRNSPAFAESIITCEKNIATFSKRDLKKIMTIHPQFGDEVVPTNTTIIPGATNLSIPSIEHMLSITLAVTLFYHSITEFLNQV